MDHDLFHPPPDPLPENVAQNTKNSKSLTTSADYNAVFEAELQQLNPAQQRAVNTIEGPVLVVAGPGTGKTQIIAARIGKILKDTDTPPHSILCLTYTDAGTVAMRQRLLQFIGPMAYQVSIHTFHAFCNEIIQDNLDYFGKRFLEPLTDLENIGILRELLDELDPENTLKRLKGDIYYEVGLLKDLFRIMKEEDWSPDHIESCIDEYLKSLPAREAYVYKRANAKKNIKAGDVKQHEIDAETGRMDKLRQGAKLFDRYRDKMMQLGRYDYSDMILWVLQAFQENENLRARYQEKYLYFLVDEFQDTNGSQNEVLRYLIDFWGTPNIFVVGDDDQSIYEFQGARLKNIMDFYHHYKNDLEVIVLKDNYRSSQPILDASRALIDNNDGRLIRQIPGLDKDLVARHETFSRSQLQPMITCYYNIRHEETDIVDQLIRLRNDGVPLKEVAVIYNRHRQAENLINLLEKKGIPYSAKKKINILDLPLIRNLINLLAYLDLEYRRPHSGEHLLFELLHVHFFGIDPVDAALVSAHCGKNYDSRWRQVISDKSVLAQLGVNDPEPVLLVGENINRWIREIPNLTLQALLEKILNWGGVLKYILQSPEQAWHMQVLTTFFDFIKSESAKNPRISIPALLKMVEEMDAGKVALEINKTVFEEDGIKFTTAHGAKGLEFRYVFLMGCTRDIWEGKGRNFGFKLPDTLTHTRDDQDREAARRLFYVAMTRAKEYLYISYAGRNNNGKPLESTSFIAEILDRYPIPVEEVQVSEEAIVSFDMASLQTVQQPVEHLLNKDRINALLEDYSMSITHLNKYLKCPVAFYYENILRVPAAKNDAMAFGSSVHYALNRLFEKMKASPDQAFPSKTEMLADFDKEMNHHKDAFTPQQFERRMALGHQVLPAYYDKYVDSWNKVVLVEYPVRNCTVEGIPVNGKLDKLEFDGSQVNVVDYKTGNVYKGRKKLNPPDDKDPLGGDYWRQLVFYKLLLDNQAGKKWEMVSGEIDFLEKEDRKNGDFVKVRQIITPADMDIVTGQIKSTYASIMDHEFSKGCGEDYCFWCQFVKKQFISEETQPDPFENMA